MITLFWFTVILVFAILLSSGGALLGFIFTNLTSFKDFSLDLTFYENFLYFSIGVCVITVFIFCICQIRKDKKNHIFKELQRYIDFQLIQVPALNEFKKVRLHVSNKLFYQGTAVPKKHIFIARAWLIAGSIHSECLEYAKCTICHELYHISCKHGYIDCFIQFFKSVLGLVSKRIRNNFYITSWYEEFNADRMGCIWYGNKELFVSKLRSMKVNSTGKEKITDHPTWEMRIRYIEHDILPTMETVTKEYYAYLDMIEQGNSKKDNEN